MAHSCRGRSDGFQNAQPGSTFGIGAHAVCYAAGSTSEASRQPNVTDFLILQSLGYILLTAAVAVLVLRTLRVPTIVAYMAAGLLLGPIGGVLTETATVELIAEAGIALLLFLVGLELSLDKIRGVGGYAALGGTLQIVFTSAAGLALGLAFGLPLAAAGVIALAVTFSSTVVVVKLLGQKNELGTLHGRVAVGILLVQDIAVVLALTLFAGLRGTGESADVGSVVGGVAGAFGGMFALAALAASAARWVLPALFRRVRRSPETIFIWSLAWCFLFIVLAELLHLSVELGSFIAGVSLAQLHFAEDLRRRVQPIVNFFLAVFFVTLGLHMDPREVFGAWPLMLALAAAVLVVKPAIMLVSLPRIGLDARSTVLTSLTLAQMSEFSFILAALATAAGVIGEDLLSAISLAGFVTIGISSYVILGSERIVQRARDRGLLRLLRASSEAATPARSRSGHIIVIGMNTLGRRLVDEFAARGFSVLAIDTDAAKLARVDADTLLGSVDDAAVLEEAAFTDALLVVSALQIEDTNNLLTYRCREVGVPVSIHAYETVLIDDLRELGAEHIMASKHDGAREIALRLREAGVLD
jgi:Kef-type K+ transport system membrane component KefB